MTYNIIQKLVLAQPKIIRHCLAWLVFISYEIAYVRFTAGIQASAFHFFVYYLLNIVLFYFNAHVVLDFAFFKTQRPYLVSFLLIVAELIVYLTIKFMMDFFLSQTHLSLSHQIQFTEKFIVLNIWRAIYFLGFSVAYFSMIYMMAFKEENHRKEAENLKEVAKNLEMNNKYFIAENAYLQGQISPHLLFNSLNFIYNSVHRISDKAGEGIILLADLMRYSLGNGKADPKVLLTEEVEHIVKLIELNQLRFEKDLHLKLIEQGDPGELEIIPLILVTMIENMIKHGDLGDAEQPGLIELTYLSDQLTFITTNKKRLSTIYPKGGLGLKNIEKRLNNYYYQKHNLSVVDTEDTFIITLTITL